MELRHLRYFIAVAEAENVSRAALKLHISQPGLSRQIHDLEAEIGVQLFVRGAQSLKLSAAGKKFLTEARAVLQRAEDAVKTVRSLAGGAFGEIHVGYAPSLTVRILPQALRRFQSEFPRVRVVLHDLSTEQMLTQLRAGELHVALLVRPAQAQLRGLHFEELARYPMCVALAPRHPLARLKNITLARVAQEPLIGYSRKDYPDYHAFLKKLFQPAGVKPHMVEEHDGITSIVAAIESGRGFALVPGCVAGMVGTRLKLIPLAPGGPAIAVGAARKVDAPAVFAEKFIAAARA